MSHNICLNCGSDQYYARGLCKRCYDYQRRMGGENRPPVQECIKTVPWNKGMTKSDDPRIAKLAQEKSVLMRGNPAVIQQMADLRSRWQGHWTETATLEKKQQVFEKIVETRRKMGTMGFTPEMTRKAVQTRKQRGSYVAWHKGLKKGDPRLAKFIGAMLSRTPEEIQEQAQKAIATRRAKGSLPLVADLRRHTRYFCRKLSLVIKRRDGYRCQACKNKYSSLKLVTHHIDGDKRNDDPLNLITLCRVCHGRVTWGKKVTLWQQILPLPFIP